MKTIRECACPLCGQPPITKEELECLKEEQMCLECYQDKVAEAEDGFQEYLESPQVLAEGIAFELYHGEVE